MEGERGIIYTFRGTTWKNISGESWCFLALTIPTGNKVVANDINQSYSLPAS